MDLLIPLTADTRMAAIAQNNAMAGVHKCNAIKNKGDQCTRNSVAHGYCGMHGNSRKTHGPLTFLLMQQGYKKKAELATLKERRRQQIEAAHALPGELSQIAVINAVRAHSEDVTLLRARYVEEERAIWARFEAAPEEDKILERTATELRRRKAEENRQNREWAANVRRDMDLRLQQWEEEQAAHGVEDEDHIVAWGAAVIAHGIGGQGRQPIIAAGGGIQWHEWAGNEGIAFAAAEPAPAERDLRAIATDAQSVHTTEVVRHTKEIVAKVRTIPVPEGYSWDKEVCSKTPGEIIAECRLSQKAAWQMMAQYAQDTAIYDIEEGIYGKVLDSVWQFVKNHAEKESLTSIIREEMQGNIGMCAQGNLTRICNVLSGYLDGVGVVETLAEKLGRLLPPLREIASRDERHIRVLDILRGNDVPFDDWDTWIDAVMED